MLSAFSSLIPHCFNNGEVWALGRSVHDQSCPVVCFSVQVCFYCNGTEVIVILKNKLSANLTLFRKYCMVGKNLAILSMLMITSILRRLPSIYICGVWKKTELFIFSSLIADKHLFYILISN